MPDAVLSPDQLPSGWTDGAADYDTFFAPVTGRFATDCLQLLGLQPGDRFLDVAAGSGALALAAAGAGAEVLATDFAPGMVDLLTRKLAASGARGSARRMDGQALELEDDSFDAAGSLFGLIFFPDLAAGARELRRVVRPGGRVVVGAWHRAGFSVPSTVMRALRSVVPGLPAPQAEFAPFRLGEPESVEALLTGAGLSDVHVELSTHVAELADPAAMFLAMPRWGAPLRPLIEGLTETQRERAAQAFAALVTAPGDSVGHMPNTAILGVGTV